MLGMTCTLRAAAAAGVETCPGSECAFWDRGCVVEQVRFPLGPEVSRYLLRLRLTLEAARAQDDARLHPRTPHS
jgi:hypothetical protein